jgi:hypothetical protein
MAGVVPSADADPADAAAWRDTIVAVIASTGDDAVLASVATHLRPETPHADEVVPALARRAETMAPGDDRRAVLTRVLAAEAAAGRRWEAARAWWDRQSSQPARDDVVAAGAEALFHAESPDLSAEDARAAAASLAHVFAETRDAELQAALVQTAVLETGAHLDPAWLRGIAPRAVTEPLRAATLALAERVASGETVDLDAFLAAALPDPDEPEPEPPADED